MIRTRLVVLALVAAIAALALPALVGAAGKATVLVSELDGQEEVPDKGDPNGKGSAEFKVKLKRKKLCFNIGFEKIETPQAGHIHAGGPGVAGEVKITLFESTGATSPAVGCVKVKRGLLKQVKRAPDAFYVNLHNAEFPAGAIRGQLAKP